MFIRASATSCHHESCQVANFPHTANFDDSDVDVMAIWVVKFPREGYIITVMMRAHVKKVGSKSLSGALSMKSVFQVFLVQ